MVRCTGQGYSDTVVGDGQTSKDWSGWSGVQDRDTQTQWLVMGRRPRIGLDGPVYRHGWTSKDGPVYRDTQTQGLVMGGRPTIGLDGPVYRTGILRHSGW